MRGWRGTCSQHKQLRRLEVARFNADNATNTASARDVLRSTRVRDNTADEGQEGALNIPRLLAKSNANIRRGLSSSPLRPCCVIQTPLRSIRCLLNHLSSASLHNGRHAAAERFEIRACNACIKTRLHAKVHGVSLESQSGWCGERRSES